MAHNKISPKTVLQQPVKSPHTNENAVKLVQHLPHKKLNFNEFTDLINKILMTIRKLQNLSDGF